MTTLHAGLYDALRSVNVPEDKARAAASGSPSSGQAATKADLAKLEAKLEVKMAKLEARLLRYILVATGLVLAAIAAMGTVLGIMLS